MIYLNRKKHAESLNSQLVVYTEYYDLASHIKCSQSILRGIEPLIAVFQISYRSSPQVPNITNNSAMETEISSVNVTQLTQLLQSLMFLQMVRFCLLYQYYEACANPCSCDQFHYINYCSNSSKVCWNCSSTPVLGPVFFLI